VRGAEGDYARWLAPAGPYHGFLLSTANAFARELATVLADPVAGKSLSDTVSLQVADAFAAVADCPHGNAFANANKALEHLFTHGLDDWGNHPAPILHGGHRLPKSALADLAKRLKNRSQTTLSAT